MNPIKPDLKLGQDSIIAKNQPQYISLPSEIARGPKGMTVLTRWQPTPEERVKIAEGEDVYLAILTFGNPLQPLLMTVGQAEMKEYFNSDPQKKK